MGKDGGMNNQASPSFGRIPSAVTAAALVSLAAFCTAVNSVAVRYLTDDGIHPLEIAFTRNAFGLLFMMPWLVRIGWVGVRTKRPVAHFTRALVNFGGMVLFFQAIALIPVADVVAINFTGPIIASVLAVLFLGELMRIRRWTAVALGFVGALIIVRPGFSEVGVGMASAILAAVAWALMQVIAKRLSRTERPAGIVTLNLLLMVPISAIPAVFVWTTPSWFALALMAMHGLLGTVNQIFIVQAFKMTDASYVMPFDFTRLPFVAVLAFVLFGEFPDVFIWLGAGIIFAATFYLTQRESRAKTRPSTDAP